MRRARVEPPPRPDHLRAIGQITANFAVLELTVQFSVWSLIDSDQRLGQLITTDLSFRKLLDLLSNLYRHRVDDPQVIKELNGLIAEATRAEEKRNLITHSFWAAGDTHETTTRVKMTARRYRGLKQQSEQMSVQDLDDIANLIAESADHIAQFMVRTQTMRWVM